MRFCLFVFFTFLFCVRAFSLFDSFIYFKIWALALAIFMLASVIFIWWRKSFIWALALLLIFPLSLHFYLKNPAFVGYSLDYIHHSRTDNSNNPTIQHGDFIVTKHFNFAIQPGAMYSVIVDNKPYRKRLHGIPGDNIHVCNLRVYVNGKNYSVDQQWLGQAVADFSKCHHLNHAFTLKPGEYYLLGDNIYNSRDSRSFGAIQKSQIFAKALYVIDADGVTSELDIHFK